MEKWVLRLVLAVLTVVTCCFVFRNTETKDRSLLYQKVQTMAEDYLGMEGMQPEEYTILDYAEIREKDAFSWWLYIETTHQE